MALTEVQYIILGIIQGITEWLPVSSSGLSVLIMSNFFNITNLEQLVKNALVLHLGTTLGAIIYLRKDIGGIFRTAINYRQSEAEEKNFVKFLFTATAISGVIGVVIFLSLKLISSNLPEITGKTITIAVATMLLVTGISQLKTKQGVKKQSDFKGRDGIVTGIAQGISALPGVSRSGLTTSTLMLKKFNDTTALRTSFLMSIPIVIIGNLLLNLNELTLTKPAIYGTITAFVFGLVSMHALIKISKKLNFAYFILIFAAVMIISVFV